MAASVDSKDQTAEVAKSLGFPVAYGVTRNDANAIGAWWEERRSFIQPSEFILDASGTVLMSTYSSSPVGRMDPAEVLTLMKFLAARRAKPRD